MKRFVFVAVMAFVCVVMVNAQPRAIGGRIGYGIEATYEHTLGDDMVTLEVGAPFFNSLEIASTYDWIDPFNALVPWDYQGEWHWYMGVGAALRASFNYNGSTFLGAAGRIGIEYDFWFPLQLSIDFRPTLGWRYYYEGEHSAFGYDLYGSAIGLGVRYKF